MDTAPYYAPTYFAASYFYSATTPTSVTTELLPYNAPTYFAPTYFYGPSSSSTTTTGLLPYNAPTYFAPTYFYGPSSTVVTPVVPTPPVPPPTPVPVVEDPYVALIASLDALGVFEEVIFGAATQRSQAGADTYPLAVVTPRGWDESDEYDPTSIVRRSTFSISVVVASRDNLPQFEQLDRLSRAITTVLDGSDLGGACLPALTRISSGRYVYSNHYPEQCIELEGEFSSIIVPPPVVAGSS